MAIHSGLWRLSQEDPPVAASGIGDTPDSGNRLERPRQQAQQAQSGGRRATRSLARSECRWMSRAAGGQVFFLLFRLLVTPFATVFDTCSLEEKTGSPSSLVSE